MVGGSLDFFTGRVRRAPSWMSRAGLEWLFRLAQEPRRMWRRYLIEDPRFVGIGRSQLATGPASTGVLRPTRGSWLHAGGAIPARPRARRARLGRRAASVPVEGQGAVATASKLSR